MRKTSRIALVAALAVAAVAVPAAAGQQFTTVRATLEPAGDPDGSGSALVEFDAKDEAVCYEIHTQTSRRRSPTRRSSPPTPAKSPLSYS
jgi:hypothetical protein